MGRRNACLGTRTSTLVEYAIEFTGHEGFPPASGVRCNRCRMMGKPEVILKSFHEKADPCQELVLFFPIRVFALSMIFSVSLPFSEAASVATLPSALSVSGCSLGASWVFSIQ
jgi:hypothetical protein